MIYIVRLNDKEYEVEVEKGKANLIKTVEISSEQNANPVSAPVVQTATVTTAAPVHAASAPEISQGGTTVTAPMPGTILDIKVSAGQKIKQGEILVILEAMKMENEIVAPCNGTVKQVIATKGSSVATNEVLIIIN